MKLSFVILIHFCIVFPVVAQEYPAKYYGGNENLEGPFKYEMGQVFGAWETYYLYFDKTTNNNKGYFLYTWDTDAGKAYGKGQFEKYKHRGKYILKYDDRLNDTVIYEYNRELSSDTLYIYTYNNYGYYSDREFIITLEYVDTTTNDQKPIDMIMHTFQSKDSTISGCYFPIAKRRIRNIRSNFFIINEYDINIQTDHLDSINVIKIIGRERYNEVIQTGYCEMLKVRKDYIIDKKRMIEYESNKYKPDKGARQNRRSYRRYYYGWLTRKKYKEHKKKFSEYELGHNSAAAFSHSESKDGDYEYDQIGLQSNEEGNVYPTYDNTIGIIQDEDNIKHMNVIK